MLRKFSFFAFTTALLWSCGDQKIDTTKAREEMESREIKVVSDAQIIEQAMKLGGEVAEKFQVSETEEGFEVAFGTDSTYQSSFYLFDEANELSGKELQLFQAYNYNRKNGIASEPNVQKLEEGKTLLYTKPMSFKDSTIGMYSIKFSRKQIVLSIN